MVHGAEIYTYVCSTERTKLFTEGVVNVGYNQPQKLNIILHILNKDRLHDLFGLS